MRSNLIIRADGNAETGLGHMFRSFALVSILENQNITFICSCNSHTAFIPKNINSIVLEKSISLSNEPEFLASKFDPNNSILITDGYQFDLEYQKRIKELGFKLIVVDDFIRDQYYADIVLNHAPIDAPENSNQSFALGIPYSLLRKDFLLNAAKERDIEPIKRCFISFGGSDYNQLALKSALAALKTNQFEEILIVSGLSSHDILLKEFGENEKVKIFNGLDAKGMIDLMKKAQVAILPCSTISYEASCLGLRVLGGTYVDNQEMIYKGMKEHDLIFDAGDYNECSESDLVSKLEQICSLDLDAVQKYLVNQQNHFDGSQIERINNLLKSLD